MKWTNRCVQKILEEKLALAQKQFSVFNSNQKNQKVELLVVVSFLQIEDVKKRIKDVDDKAADIAIKSCYGNEVGFHKI